MQKTVLSLLTLFAISLHSHADAPSCQLLSLESSAAELLKVQETAIPEVTLRPLRAESFPVNLESPRIVTILTEPSTKAFIAKLGEQAKPLDAANEGFTISTAPDDAPKSFTLTFTHGGRTTQVSLFARQSVLVAHPDRQRPDGFRLYLLGLQ